MFLKKTVCVAVGVAVCLSITSGIAQAGFIDTNDLIYESSGGALSYALADAKDSKPIAAPPVTKQASLFTQPFDGTRWNNPGRSYPKGWSHHTFTSSAMGGQTVGYTIYLPPNYTKQTATRFPVVYMLNGRGGNENTWAGMFKPSCCIIVGVNGGKNSKYMDAVPGSPMRGSYMSESAILELVSHVDATYRTQANAGGRALQGFSMGGFGAFRLGFKHPEMWSSIYTFSAAINNTVAELPITEPAFLAAMLGGHANLFGPERAQSLAAANAAAIIASGIAIRGAVGQRDGLKAVNVDMYDLLTELGIPNEGLTIVPRINHDIDYVRALDPIGWAMANFTTGGFNLASDDDTFDDNTFADASRLSALTGDVRITAVPEPASLAIILTALAAAGAMRRRRSTRASS